MFFLQRISNAARTAIIRNTPMHAPAAVRVDPVFASLVTKTVLAVVDIVPAVMIGIGVDIIVCVFADVMVGPVVDVVVVVVVGIVVVVVFGCSG